MIVLHTSSGSILSRLGELVVRDLSRGITLSSDIFLDPKLVYKYGYFVDMLEGVREALRPCMPSTIATAADNAVINTENDISLDPAEQLGSRFAALSVDEPPREFLDLFRTASYERLKTVDDNPVSYEAETQTSIEETVFAFITLINELSRVRLRIRWIWSNHRDGMFDLAAAAVASNTAISFTRGLIEEINPLLKQQEVALGGL